MRTIKLKVRGVDKKGTPYGFGLHVYNDEEEAAGIAMLKAAQAGLEAAGYECKLVRTAETEVTV